jgi:hypothetical protein
MLKANKPWSVCQARPAAKKIRLDFVSGFNIRGVLYSQFVNSARNIFSATYASRNGVPLEVVSKVFLRRQDLKTTQVYLGKINDTEAIRWMDILHGK